MKRVSFLLWVFTALSSLGAIGSPALADAVTVFAADPVCVPGATSFQTSLDYRVGVASWLHIGDWKMCVNDGGTSELIANFEGEPYSIVITILGHSTAASDGAWSFEFNRADYVNGVKIAEPSKVSFLLSPEQSTTFKLSGRYQGQVRTVRLGVTSLGLAR